MSIEYKYKDAPNLEALVELEKLFFTKKESPPETPEGLKLFFELGGKALMQIENGQIKACIEFIPIKRLNKKILSLPEASPLRHVSALNLSQYAKNPKAILIHGWITKARPTRSLYKKLFKDYGSNEIIGFVPVNNSNTLKFYLSLGSEVIDTIPRLYERDDAHYVLKALKRTS